MRWTRTPESWRESMPFLRETIGRSTVAPLYDFVGVDNYYTRSSLYVNLGYWAHARTLDDASQALAEIHLK